ncbi:LOW QUALITY PROTEIN: putative deoxyribonuclease tatdn3-A [Morphnus guianensis]
MYVVGVQDVLLHNFAGRQSVTLEGVQAGYYSSFPLAVTRHDQKLIKQIPLENICLEIDSPSLTPNRPLKNMALFLLITSSERNWERQAVTKYLVFLSSKSSNVSQAWERNEPEKIRIVCQHTAAVKSISVEGVFEVTTKMRKLFPKVNQPLSE